VEDSGYSLQSVKLFYRKKGEIQYVEIVVSVGLASYEFRESIPGDVVTSDGIEYYIEATDDLGLSSTVGTADVPLLLDLHKDIKKRINAEWLNLNIEYPVMEMPIGMLPWDYDTYLEYLYDAIRYRTVAGTSLAHASNLAKSGNFEKAELYLDAAHQSNINSLIMYTNSLNYYQSVISWNMFVAEKVKDVSFFAVSIGVNVISPGSGYYVDMFFTGVDFVVDSNLYGVEPAAKKAITEATLQTVFQKIPIPELGGVTMETYIQNMQGDKIIPVMNNLFTSEQGKYYLIEAVKDAAVSEGIEEITEEVAQSIGTEIAEKYIEIVNSGMRSIKVKSPAELRVYDSKGSVTGLINGEINENIPNSIYNEESKTVLILTVNEDYRYQFKGTATGTYGLELVYAKDFELYTVSIDNISISSNEAHDYTIKWDNFANGEKSITRKVDLNGDGIPEETIDMMLPTASFNYSPEKPVIEQNLTFDASLSNGNIISYKWEFGDGIESYGKIVNHSYSSDGIYTINLTVKDGNNALCIKQKMIFVSANLYNITFLPPITTMDEFSLVDGSTLPIKFTAIESNTGEFINDDTVNVTITNSECDAIASFTYGTCTDSVRIDPTEKQYIVNFHTKDYALNLGETYAVRVTFGEIDGLKGYDLTYFTLIENGEAKGKRQ